MSLLPRFAATHCIAIALSITLSISARAQDTDNLDLVKECDLLAAHPGDVQRVAEGVPDDRIVPRLAIRACEQAFKQEPKEPRFSFQLGRALLAGGKKAEASVEFRRAADAGHVVSWAYLGDALQFGHGQSANLDRAREAYAKARDGGFERAGELLNQLNFAPNMYSIGVMNLIANQAYQALGDLARDTNRKWLIRAHIFSLTQKFIAECDEVISPPRILSLYAFRYGGNWTAEIDAVPAVGMHAAIGEHDARTFIKRHGCDGFIGKRIFSSIDKFFTEFSE